ncbi:tetratricopeptide repeat protein, partial [bacterium]|nr:tetratricopeptide repeat protein [bacterium]
DLHPTAIAITGGAINLPGSFVSTSINQLFYRVTNSLFLANSTVSLSIVSIISGLFFVASAYYVTGIIFGKSYPGRNLLTLLLVSNGCFAIFFGGGGNIPIAVLFSFLYMISTIKYIKTNGSLMMPALLLLLSLLSHPSAIYLLPGFIYIFFIAFLSKHKRSQAVNAAGMVIILWIMCEIICPLISENAGPSKYITAFVISSFHQWNLAKSLLNIANSAMIIGPAFLAALFLLVPTRLKKNPGTSPNRQHTLLSITAISAIVIIVSGSGSVDGGIQWSLLLTTAPVFSLYLITKMKSSHDMPRFFKIALLITVSGLIHLIPIILVNSSSKAAERRISSLPLCKGRSEYIIANLARENHNTNKAVNYYYNATEKDPENDRAFYNLAEIKFKQKKYNNAATFFSKAVKLKPNNHHYRFRLAETYIEINWYDEAISILEKLTSRFGDSTLYWTKLGYALNRSKDFPRAVTAYNKANTLDPNNKTYKDNLAMATINWGIELQANGKIEEARKKFLQAVKLAPNRCGGYTNLATIEIGNGNYEKARKLLIRALRNPSIDSRTYLIMGNVMEKLGNYEKAIYYLKECKKINPMSSAGYHIKRIKAKIENKTNE